MANRATTPPAPKPEKKTRTPKSKREKAEEALAVVTRKIQAVDKRLAKARTEVDDLTKEREELLREKDYAASNPALQTQVVADPSAPGGPGAEV